jgi:hypothetical protein
MGLADTKKTSPGLTPCTISTLFYIHIYLMMDYTKTYILSG